MNEPHPRQPFVLDPDGKARFRENKIVAWLFEEGKRAGNNMNRIACLPVSIEDRRQFAQLIGYSFLGYCTLSYAEDVDILHSWEQELGLEAEEQPKPAVAPTDITDDFLRMIGQMELRISALEKAHGRRLERLETKIADLEGRPR